MSAILEKIDPWIAKAVFTTITFDPDADADEDEDEISRSTDENVSKLDRTSKLAQILSPPSIVGDAIHNIFHVIISDGTCSIPLYYKYNGGGEHSDNRNGQQIDVSNHNLEKGSLIRIRSKQWTISHTSLIRQYPDTGDGDGSREISGFYHTLPYAEERPFCMIGYDQPLPYDPTFTYFDWTDTRDIPSDNDNDPNYSPSIGSLGRTLMCMESLGCEGMSIVGSIVDVHMAIDVRRALRAIPTTKYRIRQIIRVFGFNLYGLGYEKVREKLIPTPDLMSVGCFENEYPSQYTVGLLIEINSIYDENHEKIDEKIVESQERNDVAMEDGTTPRPSRKSQDASALSSFQTSKMMTSARLQEFISPHRSTSNQNDTTTLDMSVPSTVRRSIDSNIDIPLSALGTPSPIPNRNITAMLAEDDDDSSNYSSDDKVDHNGENICDQVERDDDGCESKFVEGRIGSLVDGKGDENDDPDSFDTQLPSMKRNAEANSFAGSGGKVEKVAKNKPSPLVSIPQEVGTTSAGSQQSATSTPLETQTLNAAATGPFLNTMNVDSLPDDLQQLHGLDDSAKKHNLEIVQDTSSSPTGRKEQPKFTDSQSPLEIRPSCALDIREKNVTSEDQIITTMQIDSSPDDLLLETQPPHTFGTVNQTKCPEGGEEDRDRRQDLTKNKQKSPKSTYGYGEDRNSNQSFEAEDEVAVSLKPMGVARNFERKSCNTPKEKVIEYQTRQQNPKKDAATMNNSSSSVNRSEKIVFIDPTSLLAPSSKNAATAKKILVKRKGSGKEDGKNAKKRQKISKKKKKKMAMPWVLNTWMNEE